MKEPTPTVFRVWKSGQKTVLALFPTIPSDTMGLYCQSYEHVGQHGGADYHGCIRMTRPAKPKEYADLKKELVQRGYRVHAIQRATAAHRKELLTELKRQGRC